MKALFRTKSVASIVSEVERGGSGLKRTLGATDLVSLGIGAVIGAGIFSAIGTAAVGEVAADGTVVRYGAGPALVLSFVLQKDEPPRSDGQRPLTDWLRLQGADASPNVDVASLPVFEGDPPVWRHELAPPDASATERLARERRAWQEEHASLLAAASVDGARPNPGSALAPVYLRAPAAECQREK